MDERYLRFPIWLEVGELPQLIGKSLGIASWLLFRRLVEEDLRQNLFPEWVELNMERMAKACCLPTEEFLSRFLTLGEKGYLRIREYGEGKPVYQYRVPIPFPVEMSDEELQNRLEDLGLPTRLEMYRYWEGGTPQTVPTEVETKYDRIVRLYEAVCGLKISGRIVEDLVELAETYPYAALQEGFEAATKEGITTLAWIKKYLKRLQKHERVQKTWGRPGGLELPEGYTITPEGAGKNGGRHD
jgi:hypothetical protein